MTASDVLGPVGAGLATFFFLHIALWRAAPSNSPRMSRLALLAGVALMVSAAASTRRSGADSLAIWPVVWFDVFAIVLYVFVYAGLARSVSTTLLGRLLQAERIPFAAFAAEYAASSRFEDRLRLMHRAGLVVMAGEHVHLTRRGANLARVCELAARATAGRLEG